MIFESGMEISDKNICLTGKWIKIMKMRINKMHTRHKRGYKFTDKKQSKRGIAAWILSVISLGVLIAVIACSFQAGGNGSMYLGSAGVSSMLVGVVALFNAVLSLREENSYRFFENKDCKYFPCHKGLADFNCLFCYCPMYRLEHCPGNPRYFEKNGRRIKDCSGCTFPHDPEHYDTIMQILREA